MQYLKNKKHVKVFYIFFIKKKKALMALGYLAIYKKKRIF